VSSVDRRRLLQCGAVGAAGLFASTATSKPDAVGGAAPGFRLGLVTYNLAAAWDLNAILRVCNSVGISPVELRTTHKHGVEPALTKDQRHEVRQRFSDAGIEIWGCGTVCEFHAPDPAVVK
jgi:sugar phosphate isomerase/epimerase